MSDSLSEPARCESPLVGFELGKRIGETGAGAGVTMGECAFLGYVNLRGDASNPAFADAVASVLRAPLPLKPNTVAEGRGSVVCWLGPDEWLIMTAPGAEDELIRALRNALDDLFAAVTDVSSGFTLIAVGGERARDLLATGCSLDLHPRVFGPGRCAQTLLAKAGVLIRQRDESPLFDLVVRRSFADYLWLWLERAAEELGMTVIEIQPPAREGAEKEVPSPVASPVVA
jgi:sarcosine oxidase subunit gamma